MRLYAGTANNGVFEHTSAPPFGLYRASTGTWYLDSNGNGLWDGCATDGCIAWGGDAADQVVLGDWNSSGTTKIGVYRNGTWYLDTNGNGIWDGCGADGCLVWGRDAADQPVIGDWNGSDSTKIGISALGPGIWTITAMGPGIAAPPINA